MSDGAESDSESDDTDDDESTDGMRKDPKLTKTPLNPTRTPVPRNIAPLPLNLGFIPLLAAATVADSLLGLKGPNLTANILKCLELPRIGVNISTVPEEIFDSQGLAKSDRVEEVLGYKFNCPNLLRLARTNQSAGLSVFNNNEQLEFLGDAVLQIISTHWLYFNFPNVPEGCLTVLRICLVNNAFLARRLRRRLHSFNLSICDVLLTSTNDFSDELLSSNLRSFEIANLNADSKDDFDVSDALQ